MSEFDATVQLRINGLPFEVGPGQQLTPVTIEAVANGNDSLEMWRADTPSCGLGDAGGLFRRGERFLLTVITAAGNGCGSGGSGLKAPEFRITAA